ncbi:MAG: fluoride efflux transporter CrcB [Chitinophagaceae bacterium]|nr:fluoride efflux transporter CrcB [Chitinophagaceae bacterium]
MKQLLLVGLGGGLGSMARYLFQRFTVNHFIQAFPWGTFGVNIIGCFLIGIFWGLSFKGFDNNEQWKLFLMTGLCGGFTTFSAFTMDGIGLIREQRYFLFFSYIAASVLLGLLATFAGMKLIR